MRCYGKREREKQTGGRTDDTATALNTDGGQPQRGRLAGDQQQTERTQHVLGPRLSSEWHNHTITEKEK